MSRDTASQRQVDAANPGENTWLAANAGSGKTRVLTDRVARLLLADVSPQNILCLTYTKAAASEMQNRLFDRLGDWAMKADGELREALAALGEDGVVDLGKARRLFAAAIETPGGLKIQTIHSFCAAILRRFPLEAGVSPQFSEMDDRAAKLLQAEVVDAMAAGEHGPLVSGLAAYYNGQDLSDLTGEIVANRTRFAQDTDADEIWRWFGLTPGFAETDLPATCLDGSERALVAEAGPILATFTPTMQALADTLAGLSFDAPSNDDLARLYDAFLYKKDGSWRAEAKVKSVPTAKAAEGLGELLVPFHDFMQRVAATREREISLYSAQKALALHRFATVFLAGYEARKQARGWLDFDDLIQRAGQLMNDPALAAWVLYRLDGGIDHILVDEAQDTSPDQWRVIASLAREFTTGLSARSDRPRSLFVVGDLKQSIYSFQGADPSEFLRMQEALGQAFGDVGQALRGRKLAYSFRSSPAILGLVDAVLEAAPGLGEDRVEHFAFNADRPGRVDLWPVVEKDPVPDPHPWTDPIDTPAPGDEKVRLAEEVAKAIERLLKSESIPAKKGGFRRVRPGDILVLVRKRSEIFHQIIRACKALGLPISGADKLRVGGELAVKDLTALLAFLVTPEDDLSLAGTLRSPLFGLSEDALFRLAHGRGERYLWSVLRESGHEEAVAMLTDLRDSADFLRPYDLIERILTRHEGRRRLIARLGAEAEDGIDALLDLALAYERMETPSLTGFLVWLAAEEVEIKRQMDSAGDRIRVMTVHGAKGLEAPVVILPETAKRGTPRRGQLARLEGGQPVWRAAVDAAPEPLRAALAAEAQREREEDMRLLYVAMTRAESWLIIAAAGDVGGEGESWYRLVEAGMQRVGVEPVPFALGEGLRHASGEWVLLPGAEKDETAPPVELPGWAWRHAGTPPKLPAPLVPSDLGGAKVLPGASEGEDLERALRQGRQLHRLLEHLPAQDRARWPGLAEALLAFGEDAASPAEAAELLEDARRVLDAPELAMLFSPTALAEVEISAPTAQGRVHGVIDRLVVEETRVLAVDFKTNRAVPDRAEDIPEGLLRQMGAYEAALTEIYPDRLVETAIVWTRNATLMHLPAGLALRAFGRLDAGGPHS